MNGMTLFQTLYQTYHDKAVQVASTLSLQMLTAMLPTVRDLVGLSVLIFGALMIMGRIDAGEGMSRIVRVLIVCAIMSTANYGTFIIQMFNDTIPDQISNAIAGGTGVSLKGAQGFDGLANAVGNFSAQVSSQAVGIWWFAERFEIFLAAGLAWIMIFLTFVVWLTASACIAFLTPLGAMLAPLALFRATEGYFARWIAKILGLELVGALALMLAAFVVQANVEITRTLGHPVPAAQANTSYTQNAGLTQFTGFDVPGVAPAALGSQTAGAGGGSSINVAMSITVLFNLGLTYAFGFLILTLTSGIAMHLGNTSGFTSAPTINAVMAAAQKGGQMAVSAARAARGK